MIACLFVPTLVRQSFGGQYEDASTAITESDAPQKPAYEVLYDQGKLEEAMKELDTAYAGKKKDDEFKIWKCLIDLEKAAIMKEKGEKGYDKIAFNNFLILKVLKGRNGDNPYYWLALAKSYYLNNSVRAGDAIRKAFYYKKKFPEVSFITIQVNIEHRFISSANAYNAFLELAKDEETPPFVSAAACLKLASMDYEEYKSQAIFMGIYSKEEKEEFLKKNSNLKNNIIIYLKKATANAPDSAYRKIAEERIREIEKN